MCYTFSIIVETNGLPSLVRINFTLAALYCRHVLNEERFDCARVNSGRVIRLFVRGGANMKYSRHATITRTAVHAHNGAISRVFITATCLYCMTALVNY